MSELARTIHQGTALAGRAYESAIQTQFNSATLKRQMRKDAIEGMKEIGKKINEYGTWKDAKEAEDEAAQIENAAALGDATGDPQNKFVALKALQPPKHFSSATLFRKRMSETAEQIQERAKFKLEEAQKFDEHVKTEQMLKAAKWKLENDQRAAEEARRNEFNQQLTDYEEFLLKQQADARVQTETERHNRAMEGKPGKEPDIVTPEMAQALGYPQEWVGQKTIDARASASRLGLGKPEPKAKPEVDPALSVDEDAAKADYEDIRKKVNDPMYAVLNQDPKTGAWDPGTDPAQIIPAALQRWKDAASKAGKSKKAPSGERGDPNDMSSKSEDDLLRIITGK